MRICQVIPDLPMGGAETMCVTLSIELKKMGHDVSVISLYDCDSILTRRLKDAQIPTYFMSKRPGLDLQCIPRLRSCLRKLRPDVIHTHIHALKYTYIACLGLKIPMLRTIHNVADVDAEADTKINTYLFSRKKVVPVSISEEIRATVSEYYHIPEAYSPVIYNGVAIAQCQPKESYAINGIPELIHVGWFRTSKNHTAIVDAVKLLCEKGLSVHVSLYGDGELREEIRQKVHNLGLDAEISFMGLSDNIFPHLNKSDIFILPSLYEGSPISIIEAMGTGLPIIASDVGGIPDMIESGVSGVLINADAQSLADAIAHLVVAESKREAYGRQALQNAERFSAVTMAKGYCTLYKHLIDAKDERR